MAASILQELSARTWSLVRTQHGVITRAQLFALGYSEGAIRHRVKTGRLHPVHPGVYAVGRPALSREGQLMAAVLAGGAQSLLAGQSLAELLRFRPRLPGPIEVVVPIDVRRSVNGLRISRSDIACRVRTKPLGIPGVHPAVALVQIATRLTLGELERAVNEADAKDVIDSESLRSALDELQGMRGVKRLRDAMDRRTFSMSRSELERRFRPIARRVGLPKPETCTMHNGWEVDFLWRDLGLVVETDSLRYHRTPAQQRRDRQRDQAHVAAGDVPVRFTHGQIRYEPEYVEATLKKIATRLSSR